MIIYFLILVNWNYEVLLDWIISEETLFLQFFTRYLKKSASEFEMFSNCASNFEYDKKDPVGDEEPDSVADETSLSLTVDELLLGGVKCTKTFLISPLAEFKNSPNPYIKRMKFNDARKIFVCLESLKGNLIKLNDKNLVPFNLEPLIKIINKFLINFDK